MQVSFCSFSSVVIDKIMERSELLSHNQTQMAGQDNQTCRYLPWIACLTSRTDLMKIKTIVNIPIPRVDEPIESDCAALLIRKVAPQLIEYMVWRLDESTITVLVSVYARIWAYLVTCVLYFSRTTNSNV
jgi:hypothetical protein